MIITIKIINNSIIQIMKINILRMKIIIKNNIFKKNNNNKKIK